MSDAIGPVSGVSQSDYIQFYEEFYYLHDEAIPPVSACSKISDYSKVTACSEIVPTSLQLSNTDPDYLYGYAVDDCQFDLSVDIDSAIVGLFAKLDNKSVPRSAVEILDRLYADFADAKEEAPTDFINYLEYTNEILEEINELASIFCEEEKDIYDDLVAIRNGLNTIIRLGNI